MTRMTIETGDKPWTPCLASSSSAPPTYSSLPSLPRFPLLEDESVEAGEAREGDVASAAASLHMDVDHAVTFPSQLDMACSRPTISIRCFLVCVGWCSKGV